MTEIMKEKLPEEKSLESLKKINGGSADSSDGSITIPDIPVPVEVREEELRIPNSDVDLSKMLEEQGIDVEKNKPRSRRG